MEVKKCKRLNGELGLFATKNYNKDVVVFELSGEILDKPTKYSIHISNNKHIVDKLGVYINHSFEPSVKIVSDKVIALKNIVSGDEITFNYNASEINMAAPFTADGVNVCGKTVNQNNSN